MDRGIILFMLDDKEVKNFIKLFLKIIRTLFVDLLSAATCIC